MCGPPPDEICIEAVDAELIWCLQEWKEYATRSQTNINESERKKMKSVDCIEWFCSLVRDRLGDWSKDRRYAWLLRPRYFRKDDNWMNGAGAK